MVRYERGVNEHDGDMVTTCQQPGPSLVPKTSVDQLMICKYEIAYERRDQRDVPSASSPCSTTCSSLSILRGTIPAPMKEAFVLSIVKDRT